jgi:outer membrane lipoprotein-sorting protein
MKNRKLITLIIFALLTPCFALFGAEPDYARILKSIDDRSRFENSDFSGLFTIISEKPEKGKELFQTRMFRRDKDNKFVMLILQPDAQKGQGYLMIDDNVWLYDPESRKFSHSSLKENFQESDAKNNDFKASSLFKDYSVAASAEGKLGKFDVYIVELAATNNEVPYPKLKLWIRKDAEIMLKQESYSLSGKLVRTVAYLGYTEYKDKMIATRMLIIDELQKGEKTQVTIEDVSTDPIPDTVFTKQYLERVSR